MAGGKKKKQDKKSDSSMEHTPTKQSKPNPPGDPNATLPEDESTFEEDMYDAAESPIRSGEEVKDMGARQATGDRNTPGSSTQGITPGPSTSAISDPHLDHRAQEQISDLGMVQELSLIHI